MNNILERAQIVAKSWLKPVLVNKATPAAA